ncbi:MAG TPA: hypothetical protein VF576_00950 [Rubricoccaceae bacterium]|jgi:hypothetical protein
MRSVLFALALLTAVPALAQEGPAPYPVREGERARVTVLTGGPGGTAPWALYAGTVRYADADAVGLALDGVPPGASAEHRFLWSDVARVEHEVESRGAEVAGLLLGGLGGALVGFGVGHLLGDLYPVGGVLYGGLGGMLVGGVVGARSGNRWADLPPTAAAVRVVVPVR